MFGSYSDLPDAVRQLLSPERYGRIRQRLAAMDNRAVFEIPAMLERVLTWPDNLQAQTPATARQRHLSPKSRRRSYLNAT